MKWIIDNILETSELEEFLKSKDIEVFNISARDRILMIKDLMSFLDRNKNELVMFHGTLNDAKWLNQFGSVQTYCNLESFQCNHYYPHYSNDLLNYPYSLVAYDDLRDKMMMNKLISSFGNNGCIFIRPNSGDKLFTGGILDIRDWDKQVRNLGYDNIYPSELVLVSEPANITAEWRLWIGNGKVIGYSMYKPLKLNCCPDEVIKFAEYAASHYQPDSLFVMDVCQCYQNSAISTYKIVEINSFGCSGLYKVNLEEMIPKAMEIAEDEYRRRND